MQAMLDWVPKVAHYGGYIELDMLGPKASRWNGPAKWPPAVPAHLPVLAWCMLLPALVLLPALR